MWCPLGRSVNRLVLGLCAASSRCSRAACGMCRDRQVAHKQSCVDFQEYKITILGEPSHCLNRNDLQNDELQVVSVACKTTTRPQKCRCRRNFKGGLGYCGRHCPGFACIPLSLPLE